MSTGVGNSTHARVPSGDIEMGVIAAGPSAHSSLIDESKDARPSRLEADENVAVEGCCKRCCKSMQLKCCSDAPVFAGITTVALAAITAGGLAVWYELEDGKERAIPAAIVGVICLVAAVRMNQLRIDKKFKDRTEELQSNERILQGREQVLQQEEEGLKATLVQLQGNRQAVHKDNQKLAALVQKIQENNASFQKQIDLMHSINTMLQDIITPKEVEKAVDHTEEILGLNRQLSALQADAEKGSPRISARDTLLKGVVIRQGESEEEKEVERRETTSNVQVFPKSKCQKFCEIARPQDWSEYPVILASIASIVSTIFHATQDSDQWLAAPSAFIGVSCIIAGLVIHILGWKKQSLDVTAKKIGESISNLVDGIGELEKTTLLGLKKDIETLRGEITAIETNNKELEEQVDKLQADIEVKKKQVMEIQSIKEGFEAQVKAFQEVIDDGRKALEPPKGSPFKRRLWELEREASALRKAEEEEEKRHERRMVEKDQK